MALKDMTDQELKEAYAKVWEGPELQENILRAQALNAELKARGFLDADSYPIS